MAAVDVTILCLPDDAAREAVALAETLGPDAPRILDASTAHRIDPLWAYGYPELNMGQADRIAYAARVSQPGLLRARRHRAAAPAGRCRRSLAVNAPITINAVSGYSGGGRTMIEAHERHGGPAFELYALGLQHKHIAEIDAAWRARAAGRSSCLRSGISRAGHAGVHPAA